MVSCRGIPDTITVFRCKPNLEKLCFRHDVACCLVFVIHRHTLNNTILFPLYAVSQCVTFCARHADTAELSTMDVGDL